MAPTSDVQIGEWCCVPPPSALCKVNTGASCVPTPDPPVMLLQVTSTVASPVSLQVHFTTTLFALIRENLNIKMRTAEEQDQADMELRHTIKKIWPIQAKKNLNLIVPPDDGKYKTEAHSCLFVSVILFILVLYQVVPKYSATYSDTEDETRVKRSETNQAGSMYK